MPPQRMEPTKQERWRRQNPLRRPSPDRTPVEGPGTDHAMNADDDAHHGELATLRAELADARVQLANFAARIVAMQDRTIADLKAALEAEKTRRRADCPFNHPRAHHEHPTECDGLCEMKVFWLKRSSRS